jgi:hypothetical protein
MESNLFAKEDKGLGPIDGALTKYTKDGHSLDPANN